MATDQFAEECHRQMFPEGSGTIRQTDPEFAELFAYFAFHQVANQDDLNDHTRMLAILAALLGCQGLDVFENMTGAALNLGVTPVEIKEIIYQATAYLGIGRVYPFLKVLNGILAEGGIQMPLKSQKTVSREERLTRGNEKQVEIFGEGMRDFWNQAPQETRHINVWLAENCFGDYYTRSGLENEQRELITFCFLAAQGACESQLTSHAAGNMRIGNDRQFLIKVISQCIPYIGYPRALNALQCIDTAAKTIGIDKEER